MASVIVWTPGWIVAWSAGAQGAQCTSNFVFQDGSTVYLGQAAHCSGTGSATETNSCDSASLPIGTPVEVDGAAHPGTLAYNSWLTMQANGETDADTWAFNDLALIRLDPADVASVNPSVPGFGGPTGVGSWGGTGSTVYTYGNSSLRGGVTALNPKQGTVAPTGSVERTWWPGPSPSPRTRWGRRSSRDSASERRNQLEDGRAGPPGPALFIRRCPGPR